MTYREIRERLKERFGITVSGVALSYYWHEFYDQIFPSGATKAGPTKLMITIEIPAGVTCSVTTAETTEPQSPAR